MPWDLQVFNKQTYAAMTETVAQDIDKFNEASQGAIQLINEPFGGDFNIESVSLAGVKLTTAKYAAAQAKATKNRINLLKV